MYARMYFHPYSVNSMIICVVCLCRSVMVTYQLLQCLKEVTFCYTTMTWSKTFPETLFSALKKLLLPKRASKLKISTYVCS